MASRFTVQFAWVSLLALRRTSNKDFKIKAISSRIMFGLKLLFRRLNKTHVPRIDRLSRYILIICNWSRPFKLLQIGYHLTEKQHRSLMALNKSTHLMLPTLQVKCAVVVPTGDADIWAYRNLNELFNESQESWNTRICTPLYHVRG